MKVEPQITKDKVTVVVGKQSGNKTCISKGAGAGMVPYIQLDKRQEPEEPRWQMQQL